MNRARPDGGRASLGRAVEILRDEGLRSLWLKFLGETGYRRLDLIERDIRPSHGPIESGGHLQHEFLTAADVDEFLAFRDCAGRETVLNRIEAGHRCFLVREQGRLIHSCWTATSRARVDYLDCDIHLAPGVVYVQDAYTAPAYRGSAVSSRRSLAMEQYFSDRGFRRLLAAVWPENAPVHRSLEKAGYAVVGRIGYLGFGRIKRYFCRYAGREPPLRLLDVPGATASGYGDTYWDRVLERLHRKPHHLDPFLAALKRRENLRLVREWGALREDGRLLKTDAFEEAVGADAFLGDLTGRVGELIGMDVSGCIVARAAERHPGNALRFLTADVRQLPFSDGRFATIVSPSTLDHFPNPDDLGVSLRELFRVLEPGGRLVITLDNRQNLFDPILRLVHWMGLVPFFIGRSYTVNELSGELRAAGFQVRETTAILHNPRLVAVGAMRLVRWTRWPMLIRSTQKLMQAAQRLEKTRLCYYTGSFVAALAVRPESEARGTDESP